MSTNFADLPTVFLPYKVLIVDGMPFAYAAFHSTGFLKSSKGEKTGTRFGFMRKIMALAKKSPFDKVIICWDTPGIVSKSAIVPEYKANRVITDEKLELFGEVDKLKDLIALTRWSQVQQPGYEADDLIVTLARKAANQGAKVLVVTADRDLIQAVNERVDVLIAVMRKKGESKEELYTPAKVKEVVGVTRDQYVLWKAIHGDASDNLSPIFKKEQRDLLHALLASFPAIKKPEDFYTLLINSVFSPTSASELLTVFDSLELNLMKSPLMARLQDYYNLMLAQEPESFMVRKGKNSRVELTNLFMDLEFKSLVPRVGELVDA